MLDENTLWLLSYYRTSEISGSLFFGRLARTVRDGRMQHDLSKHYADEAQHAWYWTNCITKLDARPLPLDTAYQDRYLDAAGMPANLMEILALTQVFERRVIRQYALHSRAPELQPAIRETLDRIMQDEKWHIQWVRDALSRMAQEYGPEAVDGALKRYLEADADVYRATFSEHAHRVQHLFNHRRS
jgi:bacterioferritin (cytochrome b1)